MNCLQEKDMNCSICKKKISEKEMIKQMVTGKEMCLDCLYRELEKQEPISKY